MKLEKILPWAAVIAGAFVVAKLFDFGKKASDVLTSTGEAIGGSLYEYFHPNPEGDPMNFLITFPDGVRHQVPSRSLSSDGTFVNVGDGVVYRGDGKTYRMMIRKTDGNRFAVPV